MSKRRAEVLNKYLSNLTNLGFTKSDKKVGLVLHEIEKELGLLVIENTEPDKNPNSALVVVLKDVSGSIGIWENAVFEEYYRLAINEIKTKYKNVEELFIRHTTDAEIVEKETFFTKQIAGGTIVSSALRKLKENLGTEREVIVIQFSDGDNLTSDCVRIIELLPKDILPKVKYFKYVEANQYGRHSTLVHSTYKHIKDKNFSYYVAKEKDDALKGMRFGEELDALK